MAFDPKAYLAEETTEGFDPKAYLAESAETAEFDPVAYANSETLDATNPEIRPGVRRDRLQASPTAPEKLAALARRGVLGLSQAGAGIGQAVGDVLYMGQPNPVSRYFSAGAEAAEAEIAKNTLPVSIDPIVETPFGGLSEKDFTAAGESAIQMAPGLALGGGAPNIVKAAQVMSSAMGIQTGTQKYGERRRQGHDVLTSAGDAAVQGTAEAYFERAPALKIFEKIPGGATAAIKHVLDLTLAESATEVPTMAIQSGNDFVRANPDATFGEVMDHVVTQIPDTIKQSMALSLGIGGAKVTGGAVLRAAETTTNKISELTAVEIDEPLADATPDVGMRTAPTATQEAQIDTANQLAQMRRVGADDRAGEREAAAANRQRLRGEAEPLQARTKEREREATRAKVGETDTELGEPARARSDMVLRGEDRREENGVWLDEERRKNPDRRLAETPLEPEFDKLNEPGQPTPEEEKAPDQTFTPGQSVVVPVLGKGVTGQIVNQKGNRVWVKRDDSGKVEEVTSNQDAVYPKVEVKRGRRYEETFPAAEAEFVSVIDGPRPNDKPASPVTVSANPQKALALILGDNEGHAWGDEFTEQLVTYGTRANAKKKKTRVKKTTGPDSEVRGRAHVDPTKVPDGVKVTFRPDGVYGSDFGDGSYEIEQMQESAIVRVEYPYQPAASIKATLRERGFTSGRMGKVWTRKDWYQRPKDAGLRNRQSDPAGEKPTAVDADGRSTFTEQPAPLFDPKAAKVKAPVAVPAAKAEELSEFDRGRLEKIDKENAPEPVTRELPPSPLDEAAPGSKATNKPKSRLVSDKEYAEALNALKGVNLASLGSSGGEYMDALITIGVRKIEDGFITIKEWAKEVIDELRQRLGDDFRMPTSEELAEAFVRAKRQSSKDKAAAPKREFDKFSRAKKIAALTKSPLIPQLKSAVAFEVARQLDTLKPGEVYHLGGANFAIVNQDGQPQKVSFTPGTAKFVNDKWGYKDGDAFIRFGGKILQETNGDFDAAQKIADTREAPFRGRDYKDDDGNVVKDSDPVYLDFTKEELEEPDQEFTKQIEEMSDDELADLYYINPVTKILGRRAWDERLKAGQVKKHVLLLDLKGLKDANVAYGRKGANRILEEAAEAIRRNTDWAATLGGDEFVADSDDLDTLKAAAKEIEALLNSAPLTMRDIRTGQSGPYTVKFKHGIGETLDKADESLKRDNPAKSQSRATRPRRTPNVVGESSSGVGSGNVGGASQQNDPVQDPGQVDQAAVPADAQLTPKTQIWHLTRWLKRNLTAAGLLPDPVFAANIAKDGAINSQLKQLSYTLKDMEKAAKKAGVHNAAGWKSIDAVFKGENSLESLAEDVRPVVQKMRDHVDALSRELIASGAVEGDLVGHITENLGFYATRSYQVFDDPKWADKVPVDVRNRAKAWLRSEYPDATREEIDGLIASLLYKVEDGPISFLAKGKLGSKDLSTLKKRKDLPKELRDLWGEYDDARVNYARSVSKMAFLVANHKFLREVRRVGDHAFLFDKPIVRDGVEYKVQIAGEKSKVLEPLNGLYTSPEIKQAFEDAFADGTPPDWLRYYMRVNGTVKFSKTVLSPMTHVRNVLGNIGFAVANGHWRVQHVGKGAKAALGALNGEEFRAYFRELVELGVVHESARAELEDVIKDASQKGMERFTDDWLDQSLSVGLKKFAVGAYQAEDDIWKVFAFENESARYRKAFPKWTDRQVKEKAAEIVRKTYPTYSLVPRGVKALRRFPLTGAFVSFPAEVIRTGYNTMKLMADEMAAPETRAIGAQRLVGMMLAAGGSYTASLASMAALGMGDDEDKDLRRFMAPWDQNADLFYLGVDEKGQKRFINLGYTDPHDYLKKPLMAFVRGDDWEKALVEATGEIFAPFFGEDILAGKLLDVVRGTKTGKEIKGLGIPMHLWDAIEPGALTSGRRVYYGATDYISPTGRTYDASDEVLSVATGMRRQTVDVTQSMRFKSRATHKGMMEATREFTSVLRRAGKVTREEKLEAYDQMKAEKKRIWDEALLDVSAARRLGIGTVTMIQAMKAGGMGEDEAFKLASGVRYFDKPFGAYR